MDILLIILIVAFFWLTWGFMRACAVLAPGAEEIRK